MSSLIDTGAEISVIGEDTISQLIPNFRHRLTKSRYDEILSASGHTVPILGVFLLRFTIAQKYFKFPIHVTSALGKKTLIWGCDFHKKFKAIIDFSKNTITLNEKAESVEVCCLTTYKLRPREECLIQGYIRNSKHHLPTGLVGELEPTCTKQNVEIPSAAVSVTSSRIPIKVSNKSDSVIYLNKGYKIGTFTPWKSTQSCFQLTQNGEGCVAEPLTPHSTPEDLKQGLDYGPYITQDTVLELQDTLFDTSDLAFNFEGCNGSTAQIKTLKDLLHKHSNAFMDESGQLGFCDLIQHKITLKPGSKPFYKHQYRVSPAVRDVIDAQIDKLLTQQVLEKSTAIFNSPIIIIEKGLKRSHKHLQNNQPNRKRNHRFLIDLRHINALLIPNSMPIMRIDDLLDVIGERSTLLGKKLKYLSTFDLASGYYQIGLHPDSRDYTTFTFGNRRLRFCRLPQGLQNSPGVFCELMNTIFGEHTGPRGFLSIYLDDILVTSASFEEHMAHLDVVFSILEKHNLKLHPKKSSLLRKAIPFLGYILTPDGIKCSTSHIEAVRTFPRPHKVKEVRSFLGLCMFYRKFIPSIYEHTYSLNRLTRKGVAFSWSDNCEESFQKLKDILCSDVILKFPDYSRPFTIQTDASLKGIGGFIGQECPITKAIQPIAFCGRSLRCSEKNYSICQLELLAVIYCILYFRPYIEMTQFHLVTDCKSLKSLLATKDLSPRLARYALILQGYDFDVTYKQGLLNAASDALSRRTYPDQMGSDEEYDREDVQEQQQEDQETQYPRMETDSNTQEGNNINAIDISLFGPELRQGSVAVLTRAQRKEQNKPLNMAIKDAVNYTKRTHRAQINPQAMTGVPKPQKTRHTEKQRNKNKDKVANLYRRKRNQVDPEEMTKQALDVINDDRFCLKPDIVRKHQLADKFCLGLINYLERQILPPHRDDARRILLREYDYVMSNGLLFHIWLPIPSYSNSHFIKLVVPTSLLNTVLKLGHTATFAGHCGVNKMVSVLKSRFSHPKLLHHIRTFVANCDTCLRNKRSQALENPLLTLSDTVHAPFQRVVVDLFGPMTPSGTQKFTYAAVVVDEYSRYIVTFPLRSKSSQEFATAFYKNVILTFSCPVAIHHDMGREFDSEFFKNLCSLYGIKQTFTSGYHPHSSGKAERAVKTIVESVRNYVNEKGNNWSNYLKAAEYANNASSCSATGHSPFLLLFGRNPRFPYEGEFTEAADSLGTVSEHFCDILETQRFAYQIASEKSRSQAAMNKKHYDRNRHESKVCPGSVVYLHIPRLSHEHTKRKFSSYFRGPYVCLSRDRFDRVTLKDLVANKVLEKPIHISRLKLVTEFSPEMHYVK